MFPPHPGLQGAVLERTPGRGPLSGPGLPGTPPVGDMARAERPEPSQEPVKHRKARHYRAVFISDTHLGTRAARVDLLLDFLKTVSCDHLFLVGDIVDGWAIKRSWYWDTDHNDVIRKVLKMAKHGTKVTYIPGNHDEGLRGFEGHNMAGVELVPDMIYTAATGRRYWVLHGDQFDGVVKYAKWLAHVGDRAYGLLLRLNTLVNWLRRKMGYSYWSLSAYLKHKVKNAVEYIGKFEEAVAAEAARRGIDGVICGHIHHAERRFFGGIEYMNDGDWVESCTALVEHEDGRFEILYWADEVAARHKDVKKKRTKAKKRREDDVAPVPVAAE
ncbi:UDP-2,3-diacylglucosamine diphosphatase [Kordiimonas sp. A6E486]|nr:UDP-2,3-diacylglucosamine diphosphatase [Kordiimonas marina]MCJ9428608.1 UDP-2,3-diacylglucosamine diphosphatase [Kordiimonas marina]